MAGTGARIGVRNNGVRTLLPGAPGSQSTATVQPFTYEAAQVEEIVQNEGSDNAGRTSSTANTGRVKIRFINTEKGQKSSALQHADPLIPYQSSYPLIGEHVIVFKILGKYYYLGPINTKKKITENASPVIGILQNQLRQASDVTSTRAAAAGVTTRATVNPNKVGTNFQSLNVNPIKPFEGDVIYQGRYGNSIRLGSSQMIQSSFGEQYPNIILRAGQGPATSRTMEDGGPGALTNESINTDASSIWMVSKQILGLIPATFGTSIHLKSLFPPPTAFDGASILLNSDRLIFNAKDTSIFMFAKKGIHLNSLEDGFTVNTSGIIQLTTPNTFDILSNKEVTIKSINEDISIIAKRDVSVSGDRNITVYGNEIFLGGRSSQASPIVMAKPLKMFMLELLRTLMSTSPLTIGPTGIINPALVARFLIVYAKYMVFPDPFNPLWASNDNFVMKTNEKPMTNDLPRELSLKQISGLGSRSGQDAYATGAQMATNAGLRDLRKLYNEELISKL